MRCLSFATAALLGMTAFAALAEVLPSNLATSRGMRPFNAPALPPSTLGENAATHDYLISARAALAAGQTGMAQQSLEMAETRELDRSVPQGQTQTPSDSQLVSRIRDARRALGIGDSVHAIWMIDLALSS